MAIRSLSQRHPLTQGHWEAGSEATIRPDRERELAAAEARVRKAQGSLDRYFHAFEGGRLREDICTRRIEELSVELASLEARRSELAGEISENQPSVPDPADLAELVGDIERALSEGALPERKAVMQGRTVNSSHS